MTTRRVLFILLVLLLLPFSLKLRGDDFGQAQSLFTDIKAHKVGDILTVLIYEQSRATQKAESKSEKSTSLSADGGPGVGPLDFIPLFNMSAKNGSSFDGKGENVRNGMLRARMSVTVVSVLPNGDLVIEGSRTVGISGDRETLQLTGVVRQKDISPGNTIDSYLIADAEIHYTGKGNATTASRPGFFTRLVGWLF
ncbi:MAG: flagellar basal body L-ring protein FlgH [candidate division Zixibacteria bacterium]|nr:flagellar basal body L-ring protein FlgH [candidate division Zixibacteria bacterium]